MTDSLKMDGRWTADGPPPAPPGVPTPQTLQLPSLSPRAQWQTSKAYCQTIPISSHGVAGCGGPTDPPHSVAAWGLVSHGGSMGPALGI